MLCTIYQRIVDSSLSYPEAQVGAKLRKCNTKEIGWNMDVVHNLSKDLSKEFTSCTIYQRNVDSSLSYPEAQVGAKLRKCKTKDELAGRWMLCTIYQRICGKNSCCAQFIKGLSTLPFHNQKLKLAQSRGNARRRMNWLEDGSRTLPPCMSAQHSSGDSTSHMSQRWLFWCFFS